MAQEVKDVSGTHPVRQDLSISGCSVEMETDQGLPPFETDSNPLEATRALLYPCMNPPLEHLSQHPIHVELHRCG